MSKYSFIEAELNVPGKQCFCVDVNNSNTPFTYATQINYLLNPTPVTSAPTSVTFATTPAPKSVSKSVTSVPKPVTPAPVILTTSIEDNIVNNNLSNVDSSYLLTPDAKQKVNDRETQIINTVNNLLTTAVNNIVDQVSEQTNTVNNFKEDEEESNNTDTLNKMAYRGNKKYKLKSKSLNLLEKFGQNKCNDTCSIKKHYKKNKKSLLNSDNMIMILLLMVIAYLFLNKKQ
jgi:hypothetical protein